MQVAGSYAAVAHMGGGLTMYRLPGMQRMWACGNAADGPALLIPGTLSAGQCLSLADTCWASGVNPVRAAAAAMVMLVEWQWSASPAAHRGSAS